MAGRRCGRPPPASPPPRRRRAGGLQRRLPGGVRVEPERGDEDARPHPHARADDGQTRRRRPRRIVSAPPDKGGRASVRTAAIALAAAAVLGGFAPVGGHAPSAGSTHLAPDAAGSARLALAAGPDLVAGSGLAQPAGEVAWEPWHSLPGVVDVAGPRSDGKLVAMAAGHLFLVAP